LPLPVGPQGVAGGLPVIIFIVILKHRPHPASQDIFSILSPQ
jgi:hypothetical protein